MYLLGGIRVVLVHVVEVEEDEGEGDESVLLDLVLEPVDQMTVCLLVVTQLVQNRLRELLSGNAEELVATAVLLSDSGWDGSHDVDLLAVLFLKGSGKLNSEGLGRAVDRNFGAGYLLPADGADVYDRRLLLLLLHPLQEVLYEVL